MDAPYYNGSDMRPHSSTSGEPEPWKCMNCEAAGKGYISRGEHWHETGHHIVWGLDPRAKHAPMGAQERTDAENK